MKNGLEIVDWWQKELLQLPKKTRKLKVRIMIYCALNLWKERNRRVFEQKQKTSVEVLQEIKLEASIRNLAYGGLELS